MVKKLEKEISSLKRELAMHDTLTNRFQLPQPRRRISELALRHGKALPDFHGSGLVIETEAENLHYTKANTRSEQTKRTITLIERRRGVIPRQKCKVNKVR